MVPAFIFVLLVFPRIFLPFRLSRHRNLHNLFTGQMRLQKTAGWNSTAAYIKFNSERPERLGFLSVYEKYFYSLTFSMSGFGRHDSNLFHACPYMAEVYICVADIIRNLPSDVTGVLYYHFDAWLVPERLSVLNLNSFWTTKARNPLDGCFPVNDIPPENKQWWNIDHLINDGGPAMKDIKERLNLSSIAADEVCMGWADIYYVPRSLFDLYIAVANILYEHRINQEVGIPIIWNVFRKTTYIKEEVLPCWGDCCAVNPPASAINEYACGHRIDWSNDEQRNAFMGLFPSDQPYWDRFGTIPH